MIKPVQIKTVNGLTEIVVEYDVATQTVPLTLSIPQAVIDERLAKVREALGRDPTNQDLIDAIKAIVNDARAGASNELRVVNPVDIIGQDLEASQ